jgi:hypothetical protein
MEDLSIERLKVCTSVAIANFIGCASKSMARYTVKVLARPHRKKLNMF